VLLRVIDFRAGKVYQKSIKIFSRF
jgi:hypothetical protein